MVDWRRLLLALAQPWTTPTAEQLVSMVTTMKGRVSREEYGQTRIWLDESGEERDSRLKQVRPIQPLATVYTVGPHYRLCTLVHTL